MGSFYLRTVGIGFTASVVKVIVEGGFFQGIGCGGCGIVGLGGMSIFI